MKVLNFVRPENGLTEDPLYYLNIVPKETVAYWNAYRRCFE